MYLIKENILFMKLTNLKEKKLKTQNFLQMLIIKILFNIYTALNQMKILFSLPISAM